MIMCDATCKPWTHWGTGQYIEQECSRRASVRIDGLNLCLTHAGAIAVRKLISEGMAEQLPKLYNQKSICDLGRH